MSTHLCIYFVFPGPLAGQAYTIGLVGGGGGYWPLMYFESWPPVGIIQVVADTRHRSENQVKIEPFRPVRTILTHSDVWSTSWLSLIILQIINYKSHPFIFGKFSMIICIIFLWYQSIKSHLWNLSKIAYQLKSTYDAPLTGELSIDNLSVISYLFLTYLWKPIFLW
jgi:hypothetical protein